MPLTPYSALDDAHTQQHYVTILAIYNAVSSIRTNSTYTISHRLFILTGF